MVLKIVGISVGIIALGIAILMLVGGGEITNYPPKNERIVAFGDSLVFGTGATEGRDFVSLLSERLGRSIVNLGIPGDTTADGLLRADDVLVEEPGVVLLLLGGNDYLRRIGKETTEANLAKLIETFQSRGAVVVLLGVRGGILIDDRDDMYRALAEEYGAVYVEDVLDGIFGSAELMHDGIHPNDAGYAMIAERIYHVFREYEL